MPKKTYSFKTMKERALTAGSSLAGLAVFGLGLSRIFSPVALGVAGAYAAYKIVPQLLSSAVPALKNWSIKQDIKKGRAEEVPEDAPVCELAKEISDSLGRPQAPKIYTLNVESFAKMALPLGLHWLAKLDRYRDYLEEKVMPKVFAAVPGLNIIITTKEALAKDVSDDEMRFIMAHEMSHLQTDAFSPSVYGQALVKKISEPLYLATGVAAGLSLFGVAVPLTLGMGAVTAFGALFGIKYVTEAAVNLGMRVVEKRADRNALYITRDLQGAEDVMNLLHDSKDKVPCSLLKEATLDHPSYTRRMATLSESFNTVSQYPELEAPANDDAVQSVKQKPAAKRANAP